VSGLGELLEAARADGWTRATEALPPKGERVDVMHVLARSYDTDGEIGHDGHWQCCNGFILPNMMFTFSPTHWRPRAEQVQP
jgi:hypothetical protein